MEMTWGDKGCSYQPDKCNHAEDDGCLWCCMRCNTDNHRCPDCGTPTDHKETVCDDCNNNAADSKLEQMYKEPDKCNHAKDDGCEWCCMRCDTDNHQCPGCGTPTKHKKPVCDDCIDR